MSPSLSALRLDSERWTSHWFKLAWQAPPRWAGSPIETTPVSLIGHPVWLVQT
jgi:hypothetical protein